MNSYPVAERDFVEIVRLSEQQFGPDSRATAMYRNALGEIYTNRGNYSEAEKQFLAVVSIYDKLPGVHEEKTAVLKRLALVQYLLGKSSKASKTEERLQSLVGDSSIVSVRLELANQLFEKERYREASILYFKLLQIESLKNRLGNEEFSKISRNYRISQTKAEAAGESSIIIENQRKGE